MKFTVNEGLFLNVCVGSSFTAMLIGVFNIPYVVFSILTFPVFIFYLYKLFKKEAKE